MEPNKLIKLLRELKRDDAMVVFTDEAIDNLIDIVEKHQKIEQIIERERTTIISDLGLYKEISEVVEDGNDNRDRRTNDRTRS